jgi:hypothetical protein
MMFFGSKRARVWLSEIITHTRYMWNGPGCLSPFDQCGVECWKWNNGYIKPLMGGREEHGFLALSYSMTWRLTEDLLRPS